MQFFNILLPQLYIIEVIVSKGLRSIEILQASTEIQAIISSSWFSDIFGRSKSELTHFSPVSHFYTL